MAIRIFTLWCCYFYISRECKTIFPPLFSYNTISIRAKGNTQESEKMLSQFPLLSVFVIELFDFPWGIPNLFTSKNLEVAPGEITVSLKFDSIRHF